MRLALDKRVPLISGKVLYLVPKLHLGTTMNAKPSLETSKSMVGNAHPTFFRYPFAFWATTS
jgi:hypothetical protein